MTSTSKRNASGQREELGMSCGTKTFKRVRYRSWRSKTNR